MTRPPLPAELVEPHPRRCDATQTWYETAMEAHRQAVSRGQSFYVDPATRLMVMTAYALWQNDTCCERGCRHCPYVQRDT